MAMKPQKSKINQKSEIFKCARKSRFPAFGSRKSEDFLEIKIFRHKKISYLHIR